MGCKGRVSDCSLALVQRRQQQEVEKRPLDLEKPSIPQYQGLIQDGTMAHPSWPAGEAIGVRASAHRAFPSPTEELQDGSQT